MQNQHCDHITGTINDVINIKGSVLDVRGIAAEITIPASFNYDYYKGSYKVVPKANNEVVLPTTGKVMQDDVTVSKVPIFETHNILGSTIYIASEV